MRNVDFVIPYLNSNDEKWKKSYLDFCNDYDFGDKNINRITDWNTLKYVLRSIETNCKWYHKIILVVFGETQIPSWLNTSSNKLKILYHKDILPDTCYPTFNSLCVSTFATWSKEISEHFIYLCDDEFINRKFEENEFFNDEDKCLRYKDSTKKFYIDDSISIWNLLSKNTAEYAKITIKNTYSLNHVPLACKKTYFTNFYEEHKNDIIEHFSKAENKIRNSTNIAFHYIGAWNLMNHKDFFINEKIMRGFCNIRDNTNWNSIFSSFLTDDLVCINDSFISSDIKVKNETFNRLIKILETVYPNKSSLEL